MWGKNRAASLLRKTGLDLLKTVGNVVGLVRDVVQLLLVLDAAVVLATSVTSPWFRCGFVRFCCGKNAHPRKVVRAGEMQIRQHLGQKFDGKVRGQFRD